MDIKVEDYEFVVTKEKRECKVYKQFHLDKPIGRVVMSGDGVYENYNQLPIPILDKALEYLGYIRQ